MSLRYCLNVHGEMLCDGPQDHDGGCTFTAGWQLVRRVEDDFASLVGYAGDTTNELRALRESVFAAAQQVRREGYTALAQRLEQEIEDASRLTEGSEQAGACAYPPGHTGEHSWASIPQFNPALCRHGYDLTQADDCPLCRAAEALSGGDPTEKWCRICGVYGCEHVFPGAADFYPEDQAWERRSQAR